MKKYILIPIAIFALFASSCNDDYLEKTPIESQTEVTAFKTYDNFKTYAWGMYGVFADYTQMTRTIDSYSWYSRGDCWAGYLNFINQNSANYYATNNILVPAGKNDNSGSFSYASGGWDFSTIRRINIMLQNIDQSGMTDADKNHWRSVGYFFHAYLYMELVSRFGNVPWVDKVIGDGDEAAYAPRNPRAQVVDKIMEELLFAESNIKAAGDGANTINKACVQVLISRLGLFEGTWRKYHNGTTYGVDEANAKYKINDLLTQSARASEALMVAYPTLLSNYDKLLNSESLAGAAGVILFKEYVDGVIMHYMGRYIRTSENRFEVPKYTIELYLTKNGLPIHNANNQFPAKSDGYCSDSTIYNEFRNRDYRLLMSVVPPYFDAVGAGYDYTPPAQYAVNVNEYANLLPTILTDPTSKRLPVFNFAGTKINQMPNVIGPGQAPLRSYTGYSTFRLYNLWEYSSGATFCNTADKPIFHMGEILLNYAEAKWELGQFNQTIANKTINMLRARVGTANMVVANIDANFDPDRDPTVDPVLWEIRRERIVELLGEGFGFDDVRRWKKAPWFISRKIIGNYMRYTDYSKNNVPNAAWKKVALVNQDFSPAANAGYIKRFDQTASGTGGWLDKYYLLPIPLNELALNPNLKQNPGW